MLLQQLRINSEWREEFPEQVPGRGWWFAGGVLVMTAVVIGGATLALRSRNPMDRAGVSAFSPASAVSASSVLQANGYVTARRQATVSPQIAGTLTDVLVDEGDHVKEGQVLAHLENATQRSSLAQAEAQLKAARALLLQSQAQLKQQYRDLVRNEELVARSLVSMQALETARTLVESQVAQVESQRRQVDLAEAAVKGAQVALDYTTVRAPFSGVVIAQPANAGEYTQPMSGGDSSHAGVATIVDMDSLDIEVDINEAYINRVQSGQPVQVVPDAYPDWTIPAHVEATIPTADRTKATVKVRIALDVKDPRILPDMGVRISFAHATADPGPGTRSSTISRAAHSS